MQDTRTGRRVKRPDRIFVILHISLAFTKGKTVQQSTTKDPEKTIMEFVPGRGYEQAPWEPGGVPIPTWTWALHHQGLSWESSGLYVKMLLHSQEKIPLDLQTQSDLSGESVEDLFDCVSQLQNFGLIEKAGDKFVIHLLPDLDNDSHAAAVRLSDSAKEPRK